MKKQVFFFVWLMLLAVGLMCVITITQIITTRSQKALEEGNTQAAATFTLNNKLEEMVNLSFSVESNLNNIINKKNKDTTYIGLKDTLTQLGYNMSILQMMAIDSANKKELKKVAGFINKQIDFCFKIIEPLKNKSGTEQKIYFDSLVNMHVGDSIYSNAITFQKKLEKGLQRNLAQNNRESNRLALLNFLLAIVSLLAILLLVMIIIKRQKKQLLLIEDLKEARTQALRSGEIKDRFLANMSHEIRTPLNALQGFSRLLANTDLGKEQKRYSNIIYTASQNLLLIVNDILDFSKIESDAFPIRQAFFNVKTSINELEIMFETLAAEKGLQLKINTDKNINTLLYGDADRLKQVLINLIGNAIKFTNDGSITLTTIIQHQTETNVTLQFSVVDTGIGIPEKNMATVFERFEQVDNSFTRNQGGTGLGLAIVKKITELMGGEVAVQSKIGIGSNFIVTLPFVKQTEKTETDLDYELPILQILFSNKKILIAEDNRMNQMLIESLLQKYGVAFDMVENGKEAIDYLQQSMPDLVLMDVQMPDMDGISATTIIRKKYGSRLPIVAMTAHVLEQEKTNCLQAGMNKYLTKPIDENELIQVLNDLLANTESTTNVSKKLPYKNMEYLKTICNNDPNIINKILIQLAVQIPEETEQLQQLAQSNNIPGLKKLLHNFKSTLSALDNEDIAVMAINNYAAKLNEISGKVLAAPPVDELVHALKRCEEDIKNMIV